MRQNSPRCSFAACLLAAHVLDLPVRPRASPQQSHVAADARERGTRNLPDEPFDLCRVSGGAGFGDTDLIIYARAEAAMERVLQRVQHSRAWTLDTNDIPLFEAMLRHSDRQLANAPRHVHLGGRYRLDRF